MSILDKYHLSFSKSEKDQTQEKSSIHNPIGHHLTGYLMGQSVEFITEDVLPELSKALSGNSFDEDAGGFLSFLTIGPSICIFSSINEAETDCSIPTNDLNEILLIWVKWINENQIKTPGYLL